MRSRSFLALGVDAPRMDRAAALLRDRHGALILDLTGVLLDALHAQSEGKRPWSDVVAADAMQPGSRESLGLARLVELALPGCMASAATTSDQGILPSD